MDEKRYIPQDVGLAHDVEMTGTYKPLPKSFYESSRERDRAMHDRIMSVMNNLTGFKVDGLSAMQGGPKGAPASSGQAGTASTKTTPAKDDKAAAGAALQVELPVGITRLFAGIKYPNG